MAGHHTLGAGDEDALEAFLVRRFTIRLRRPRGIVATDGELHTMIAPLEYRWVPDAVRIVVP